MDDGGKSVYNQTILHTRAFNVDDVKYIQSVLLKNFGLISSLEEPCSEETSSPELVFNKTCFVENEFSTKTSLEEPCSEETSSPELVFNKTCFVENEFSTKTSLEEPCSEETSSPELVPPKFEESNWFDSKTSFKKKLFLG